MPNDILNLLIFQVCLILFQAVFWSINYNNHLHFQYLAVIVHFEFITLSP